MTTRVETSGLLLATAFSGVAVCPWCVSKLETSKQGRRFKV